MIDGRSFCLKNGHSWLSTAVALRKPGLNLVRSSSMNAMVQNVVVVLNSSSCCSHEVATTTRKHRQKIHSQPIGLQPASTLGCAQRLRGYCSTQLPPWQPASTLGCARRLRGCCTTNHHSNAGLRTTATWLLRHPPPQQRWTAYDGYVANANHQPPQQRWAACDGCVAAAPPTTTATLGCARRLRGQCQPPTTTATLGCARRPRGCCTTNHHSNAGLRTTAAWLMPTTNHHSNAGLRTTMSRTAATPAATAMITTTATATTATATTQKTATPNVTPLDGEQRSREVATTTRKHRQKIRSQPIGLQDA